MNDSSDEYEKELRLKLFSASESQILADRSKSFEAYDKALLTLSAGGLALSITLIGNPTFSTATCKDFLYCSWILFTLVIILTIGSFITSQYALDRQRDLLASYYIYKQDEALSEKNRWSTTTKVLNVSAGILFVLAVTFLLYFAYITVAAK